MKEIDTDVPFIWPAWCYSSGNTTTTAELSKHSPIASSSLSSSSSEATIGDSHSVTNKKTRTKRKNSFTTKQLPPANLSSTTVVESVNGSNKFDLETSSKTVANSHSTLSALIAKRPASSPSQATATPSAADKMLSDHRMHLGYNLIENSKKHQICDNNSTYLYLDQVVKNETQIMESLKDNITTSSDSANNNNNNNVNISNNSSNARSTNNNNCVKRERLSPATNGGEPLQQSSTSISRSRSATPSSFRGSPPQNAPSTDIAMQNLSTNLLSSIQGRSNDFSTRNYSDFMRSLAAKYNNCNPNDTSRRSTFFESGKPATIAPKTSKEPATSHSEAKTQSIPQTLPTSSASNVSPFMTSLLSSLPFSSTGFPPLIDLGSTQALVTLARAAKEAEIQSVLRTAQKRPSTASRSLSSSPRSTNLNAAIQQAAQFATPALLYSAQFQNRQSSPQPRQQHPSPAISSVTSIAVSGKTTTTASPLDLSSAPQAKRFKAETTSNLELSSSSLDASPPPTTATTTTTATPVLPLRQCQAQSDEVNAWTVENVCEFVGSIGNCEEYVQNFRDQCIDGSGLPLLTEEHLTNSLGMKLGPALKLRTQLAKKLGGPCPCVSCSTQAQLIAAQQAAAVASNSISPSSSQSQLAASQQQQLSTTNLSEFACNARSNCSTASSSNNNSNQLGHSNQSRPASADSGSS